MLLQRHAPISDLCRFYRDLIAQRSTAISLYMVFGGTNWGAFAAPVVATSYDYSSPISESRRIDSKFYETKNLALFTRVAEDLTVTNRLGNNTGYSTNPAIEASELRNPLTKGAFYVTRHTESSSGTVESFKLHVSTSVGNLTIPQHAGSIVINGHQSKILVTDFAIGDETLAYSTAEVLTYAMVDSKPVVVLSTGVGESVEFHVKDARNGSATSPGGRTNATFHSEAGGITANIAGVYGMGVYAFDNGVKIVVVDKPTAYLFWAPNLSNDPFAPVDQSSKSYGTIVMRTSLTYRSPGSRSIPCSQRQRRGRLPSAEGRHFERHHSRSLRKLQRGITLMERQATAHYSYSIRQLESNGRRFQWHHPAPLIEHLESSRHPTGEATLVR